MNFTRVTAHFDTTANAKKAYKALLKQQPLGCFDHIEVKNKKVSMENDCTYLRGSKKQYIKLALERSRNVVLHWLGNCKGLVYTILVSR